MKTGTNSEHLWQVVSLLAAAVILPTVCLLWFMTEAVKNEQLATRQKLINHYSAKADSLADFAETHWDNYAQSVLTIAQFVNEHSAPVIDSDKSSLCAGLLIFDENNEFVYPAFDLLPQAEGQPFKAAWRMEFVEKQYDKAGEEYMRIAEPNAPAAIKQTALLGQARCLEKAGRPAEAKELYSQLAQPAAETNPIIAAQARLRLAEIYLETSAPELAEYCRQIVQNNFTDLKIPAATRVYLLESLLALISKAGLDESLLPAIEKTQRLVVFEKLSLLAAEKFAGNPATDGVYPIIEGFYGYAVHKDGWAAIGLVAGKRIAEKFTAVAELDDDLVFYRIYDPAGEIVAGQQKMYLGREVSFGQPFLSRPLANSFPGWKLEIFFRYGVFESAAKRQKIIYLWTAALVIGLMTLISIFSASAILRQARLNRLKNDFIATVTHELKTPLSSMRLLVDTLLDGSFADQKRCREYLELISGENHRLSRLIDSFLTFSRMERNKQAFDIVKTNPAEIAKAAAEAMQTKFNEKNCKFTASIDDNLPVIMADKDAMITALVNLLDNAYKYSYDDKQIELKVFAQDDMICFMVKDNGIGMTGRQVKKIFDKFYQADTSLTRRTEGAGLGLSIVKFIVDAHKGKIDVESQPGKGSEFVIRLNTA